MIAEELGCDVETDLDALFSREDVDAVIVASPSEFPIREFQINEEHIVLVAELLASVRHISVLEYGSAFHWPEHYVLIQGTKGAIRLDQANVGMNL